MVSETSNTYAIHNNVSWVSRLVTTCSRATRETKGEKNLNCGVQGNEILRDREIEWEKDRDKERHCDARMHSTMIVVSLKCVIVHVVMHNLIK